MPRLFTGLELPESVVGQIALARGGVIGARWLEPEDYHVTLRFVGDVDARTAHDIAETLGRDPPPRRSGPLRRARLVRRRQAARDSSRGSRRSRR